MLCLGFTRQGCNGTIGSHKVLERGIYIFLVYVYATLYIYIIYIYILCLYIYNIFILTQLQNANYIQDQGTHSGEDGTIV